MEKTNQGLRTNLINSSQVLAEINIQKQKYSAFLRADEPFEKLKTILLKIKTLESRLTAENGMLVIE